MWTIDGVDLPDDVLRKLYFENAAKLIPGVAERVEAFQADTRPRLRSPVHLITREGTVSEADFAMICCACGAEQVVKESIANEGWRLAFSRPGFVTAKHDGAADLPEGVFIRTVSRLRSARLAATRPKLLIETLSDRLQTHSRVAAAV